MSVSLRGTDILFNDNSTQTTASKKVLIVASAITNVSYWGALCGTYADYSVLEMQFAFAYTAYYNGTMTFQAQVSSLISGTYWTRNWSWIKSQVSGVQTAPVINKSSNANYPYLIESVSNNYTINGKYPLITGRLTLYLPTLDANINQVGPFMESACWGPAYASGAALSTATMQAGPANSTSWSSPAASNTDQTYFGVSMTSTFNGYGQYAIYGTKR